MSRMFMLVLILCLILGFGALTVDATKIEKDGVRIGSGEYIGEELTGADKDEEITVRITSNIPVDVYIMTSDDYFSYSGQYFWDAEYKNYEVTNLYLDHSIEEDAVYYLVINNPGYDTATVDYEYRDSETSAEDAIYGFALCAVCIIGVVVIVIVIIYFLLRRRKRVVPQAPAYPQQPQYYQQPPPQQPYYQPPPQPQYPPPQQPPQQPPPPQPPSYQQQQSQQQPYYQQQQRRPPGY